MLPSTMVGCCPPQKVLHREHVAVFTDARESECTSSFDFTDHVAQEICAPPQNTLREIVPSLVVLQNLPPNVGRCLLCLPRRVLVIEPS